jgi:chromosome segregation ATPase
MADEGEHLHMEPQSNTGKWILTLLAVIFVAASGYAHYAEQAKISKLTDELNANQVQFKELENRMQNSEAQAETLARQAGMTKQDLVQKTADLRAQQKATEARVEQEQKDISQVNGEIAGVKTDVGGVKTDVGGVKTDVASTQADLASTKARLQSAIGDLGVQSGLIANTRSDLEVLKHKGDRNYYEFTLLRGAQPQAVATVSLQLKKTDAKKGKYTMNVTSDDRTIEKKDRNVSEPIQFYSGRDHLLFELVVWTVDKNKATGYLSTPKNAPTPVTAN